MMPPDWVCHELERIAPQVRLGWQGREKTCPEDLNNGTFYLLELVPARKADATFRTRWLQGPVFGSSYDLLSQVPLMVYDVAAEDVFSGRVVHLLRRWLTPIRERVGKPWDERQKQWRSNIRQIAEQAGDELYWKAQRGTSDGGVVNVPKKFITQDEKDRLTGDWAEKYKPEPAPGIAPIAVL